MTVRRCVLLLLVLALAVPASAQTTSTILWDYAGTSAATANAYAHTVTVDGAAAVGTVTCAGTTVATCQVSVPALSRGPHSITVTAVQSGVAQATTAAINTANGPAAQGNIRVSVTVQVTVP